MYTRAQPTITPQSNHVYAVWFKRPTFRSTLWFLWPPWCTPTDGCGTRPLGEQSWRVLLKMGRLPWLMRRPALPDEDAKCDVSGTLWAAREQTLHQAALCISGDGGEFSNTARTHYLLLMMEDLWIHIAWRGDPRNFLPPKRLNAYLSAPSPKSMLKNRCVVRNGWLLPSDVSTSFILLSTLTWGQGG